jgi:hypothetical protein
MVMVTTASGRRQKFDPRKIHRTCIRAGASRKLADEIVQEIQGQIYEGIPTRKILQMVLDEMRKHRAENLACRYDLKSAIMRMGPAGFAFETFLSRVLENQGYQTKLRQRIQGLCVEHEIDIVMEKDGERHMVEVKYHNAPGIYTGLKEAMYTFSRFMDLSQGHEAGTCKEYDHAWLATNTRSSREARKYALCKGIHLLGWKYPPRKGIEKMIEQKGLYPVTVLHSLDRKAFNALAKAELLLVPDLAESNPKSLSRTAKLSLRAAERLVSQSQRVMESSP